MPMTKKSKSNPLTVGQKLEKYLQERNKNWDKPLYRHVWGITHGVNGMFKGFIISEDEVPATIRSGARNGKYWGVIACKIVGYGAGFSYYKTKPWTMTVGDVIVLSDGEDEAWGEVIAVKEAGE